MDLYVMTFWVREDDDEDEIMLDGSAEEFNLVDLVKDGVYPEEEVRRRIVGEFPAGGQVRDDIINSKSKSLNDVAGYRNLYIVVNQKFMIRCRMETRKNPVLYCVPVKITLHPYLFHKVLPPCLCTCVLRQYLTRKRRKGRFLSLKSCTRLCFLCWSYAPVCAF